MDRRQWLASAAMGLGALGFAKEVFAETKKDKKAGHAHHHGDANPFQKAIDAAADCAKKGEACVAHCQLMSAKGDNSMADCLRTSLEMIAGCQAFIRLASLQSKSVKKMAAVCAELCRECEKTCKAQDGHAVCKECMDACIACAKECDKIAA